MFTSLGSVWQSLPQGKSSPSLSHSQETSKNVPVLASVTPLESPCPLLLLSVPPFVAGARLLTTATLPKRPDSKLKMSARSKGFEWSATGFQPSSASS